MINRFNSTILMIFFALGIFSDAVLYCDDIVIEDISFRFKITLPSGWEKKDFIVTKDKDGISYSFERKDKKITLMMLAFKLQTVKNIDDFIYNMEKDVSLNIPPRSGEFTEKDFGIYDMKQGIYIDNNFYEEIFYFRTKLPDAPNNYVYMIRFITTPLDINKDGEAEIKKIVDSFKSTVE